MDRRSFFVTLGVSLLARPLSTDAQQRSRGRWIGSLAVGSGSPGTPHLEAFRQGLGDLGWVEGKNIVLAVRVGKYEELPEFAADFARLKVDLIFAATTPGVLAAVPTAPACGARG